MMLSEYTIENNTDLKSLTNELKLIEKLRKKFLF